MEYLTFFAKKCWSLHSPITVVFLTFIVRSAAHDKVFVIVVSVALVLIFFLCLFFSRSFFVLAHNDLIVVLHLGHGCLDKVIGSSCSLRVGGVDFGCILLCYATLIAFLLCGRRRHELLLLCSLNIFLEIWVQTRLDHLEVLRIAHLLLVVDFSALPLSQECQWVFFLFFND